MTIPAHIQTAMQAYYAERATPEDIAALEDWFRADEAHIKIFAEHGIVEWHMLCEHEKLDAAAVLSILHEAEENAEPDFSLLHTPVIETTPSQSDSDALTLREVWSVASYALAKGLRTKAAVYGSIAAMLVLGTVLYVSIVGLGTAPAPQGIADHTSPKPAESAPPILRDHSVATLTATHNAQWAEGALAPGSRLHPNQRLTLTAGFAEITTNDGAVAILEAPATIELLDNNNAIRLHTGKLVGLCHSPLSKGFVVKTRHGEVVDLGTEFGVEVEYRRLTTTVFTGEVEFATPGGEPQRLTSHQTARVNINGNNRQIVIEDRVASGFTKRLPGTTLVTAAYINLEGHEVQVVPQGVAEDARIRTDRDHEINGIDPNGIPAALLGGDLVRTPSNASVRLSGADAKALRVDLELAQAATVYLLISSNHKQTPWLTEAYERTDMRVGFDMGVKSGGQSVPELTGVGPGQSIDAELEVWRRKAVAVGRVTVGQHMSDTMYTIVVVPADEGGKMP